METGDERDGQMEAEPLLGEVIAALQELRAEVIQVRTGGHAESELAEVNLGFRGTFISVLAVNSQLETSRVPGSLAEVRRGIEKMDQSIALTKAIRAIDPDYLLETIDAAIRLAESQG